MKLKEIMKTTDVKLMESIDGNFYEDELQRPLTDVLTKLKRWQLNGFDARKRDEIVSDLSTIIDIIRENV